MTREDLEWLKEQYVDDALYAISSYHSGASAERAHENLQRAEALFDELLATHSFDAQVAQQ